MGTQTQTKNVPMRIEALLSQENVRGRFNEMLGKKAACFISSIISAVNANAKLKEADPMTVVSAAAVAASLELPINPSLGFAHIVPYDGRAQFQMGWRGYVQLGQRSGQYLTMNVSPVYEGELKRKNRFTGEFEFDEGSKVSDTVIGYVAFFRLLNGFEKYLFMTVDEIEAHGKRYSKTYSNPNGSWKTQNEAMRMKTVIKLLLNKWGIMSIEMVKAVEADQAVVRDTGDYEYPDSPEQAEADLEEIKKFDDMVVVMKPDMRSFNAFLAQAAKAAKMDVDQLKVEAYRQFDGFWASFEKWKASKNTGKKEEVKPPNVDDVPPGYEAEMKYVQCADRQGDMTKVSFCESECKNRQGCPAFE